jgi:flagellar protein FlbD
VILLTRLGGAELALNPDLVERAEPTPDTVITMIDGHKIVVAESITEVVDRIRTWRASVVAEACVLSRNGFRVTGARVEELEELTAQETRGHASAQPHSARVLRLPLREE